MSGVWGSQLGDALTAERVDGQRTGGFYSGPYGPRWRTTPKDSPAPQPEDRAPLVPALHAKLRINYDPRGPSFAKSSNELNVMNPGVLNEAAHELEHAYDHLSGRLDAGNPAHTLHSELNAHTQQEKVAGEAGEDLPNWRDDSGRRRSAYQQAATYVGKVQKGYQGGSLEESAAAVERWHAERRAAEQPEPVLGAAASSSSSIAGTGLRVRPWRLDESGRWKRCD